MLARWDTQYEAIDPFMEMARKKAAATAPADPKHGDSEHLGVDGTGHSEEPKRSTRIPTVPFHLSLRHRQKAQNTDVEDSHETLSSSQTEVPEAIALQNGVQESEAKAEVEVEVEAPVTLPEKPEVPNGHARRSGRAIEKPAKDPRKSLVVTLRMNPVRMAAVIPGAVKRPADQPDLGAPRIKRQKTSKKEKEPKTSNPIPLSPVITEASEDRIPPAEESPTGRPKRARKKREKEPDMTEGDEIDEPSPPEEPVPRKKRKYTRRKPIEANVPPQEPSPVEPHFPPPPAIKIKIPVVTSAPSSAPITPRIAELPVAVQTDVASNKAANSSGAQTPVDLTMRDSPVLEEAPIQKRRGRPPQKGSKKYLLAQQQQQQQQQQHNHQQQQYQPQSLPQMLPAQARHINEFRSKLPPGMTIPKFIMLAKHMREKGIRPTLRPLRRIIKKGFRNPHRVSREWCADRTQTLVDHLKGLRTCMKKGNIGILEQTIAAAVHISDYVTENGPAADFYRQGVIDAEARRKMQQEYCNARKRMEKELADKESDYLRFASNLQLVDTMAILREKVDAYQGLLGESLLELLKEKPELIDEWLEEAEEEGEDVSIGIWDRLYDRMSSKKIKPIQKSTPETWYYLADPEKYRSDEETSEEESEAEAAPRDIILDSRKRSKAIWGNRGITMGGRFKHEPPKEYNSNGVDQQGEWTNERTSDEDHWVLNGAEKQPEESAERVQPRMPRYFGQFSGFHEHSGKSKAEKPPLEPQPPKPIQPVVEGQNFDDLLEAIQNAQEEEQEAAANKQDLPETIENDDVEEDVPADSGPTFTEAALFEFFLAKVAEAPVPQVSLDVLNTLKSIDQETVSPKDAVTTEEVVPSDDVEMEMEMAVPGNNEETISKEEVITDDAVKDSPPSEEITGNLAMKERSPAPGFYGGPASVRSSSPALSLGAGSSLGGESRRLFMEDAGEPGFVLSGPAPPPDVLRPSPSYQEPEVRSRFASTPADAQRWGSREKGGNYASASERSSASPFNPHQHHHYMPASRQQHTPSPLLSHASHRSSSVSSIPPTTIHSPGRVLPSPVPNNRYPAAHQAIIQRSPSPPIFGSLQNTRFINKFQSAEQGQ